MEVVDSKPEESLKDRAKREAKAEIDQEVFEEAKKKLKDLYRKLVSAEKVVKNIKNEITDLEMETKESLG